MAEKYNQEAVQGYPLAPPTMPRSDQESAPTTTDYHYQSQLAAMKKKKRMKCFAYLTFLAILQAAVILAIIVVFVRIRTPSVRLTDVDVSNSISGNVVLTGRVLIRNRNFGRYKFDDSIGSISSGDSIVGAFQIPDGRARLRSTRRISVVANLITGNRTGILPLTFNARLRGEVEFARVIERRRNAELNCAMNVDLSNNQVQGLRCS